MQSFVVHCGIYTYTHLIIKGKIVEDSRRQSLSHNPSTEFTLFLSIAYSTFQNLCFVVVFRKKFSQSADWKKRGLPTDILSGKIRIKLGTMMLKLTALFCFLRGCYRFEQLPFMFIHPRKLRLPLDT